MKKKRFLKMVLLCLSFVLCMGIFVGCGDGETAEDKERHRKYDVYRSATEFVKDELKAPSTAEFPEFEEEFVKGSDGKYHVESYYDAENGFGAKIRGKYSCDIEDTGDGRWKMTNMKIQ